MTMMEWGLVIIALLMYFFFEEIVTCLVFNFGSMSANIDWRKRLSKDKGHNDSEIEYKKIRKKLITAIKEKFDNGLSLDNFWIRVGTLKEYHKESLRKEITEAGYDIIAGDIDCNNWSLVIRKEKK